MIEKYHGPGLCQICGQNKQELIELTKTVVQLCTDCHSAYIVDGNPYHLYCICGRTPIPESPDGFCSDCFRRLDRKGMICKVCKRRSILDGHPDRRVTKCSTCDNKYCGVCHRDHWPASQSKCDIVLTDSLEEYF